MITPRNEQGVVVLFQELSKELEYELVDVQTPFPDAVVIDKYGKELKVEFEYYASNFKAHKHDLNGCDLIVCWVDNTNNFPIPVLSLKDYLEDKEYKREESIKSFINFGAYISHLMIFTIYLSVIFLSTDLVLSCILGVSLLLHISVLLYRLIYQGQNYV